MDEHTHMYTFTHLYIHVDTCIKHQDSVHIPEKQCNTIQALSVYKNVKSGSRKLDKHKSIINNIYYKRTYSSGLIKIYVVILPIHRLVRSCDSSYIYM